MGEGEEVGGNPRTVVDDAGDVFDVVFAGRLLGGVGDDKSAQLAVAEWGLYPFADGVIVFPIGGVVGKRPVDGEVEGNVQVGHRRWAALGGV